MFEVSAYTDWACSGNPGPAGVGVVLLCGKHRKEISRPLGNSTNNRAEIQAVIDALRCLHRPEKTEFTLLNFPKGTLFNRVKLTTGSSPPASPERPQARDGGQVRAARVGRPTGG